jgi:hypothetical protein
VIHAPELLVKKHPAYVSAKSGDAEAAFSLVRDTLAPQAAQELQSLLGERRPILSSVHGANICATSGIESKTWART